MFQFLVYFLLHQLLLHELKWISGKKILHCLRGFLLVPSEQTLHVWSCLELPAFVSHVSCCSPGGDETGTVEGEEVGDYFWNTEYAELCLKF